MRIAERALEIVNEGVQPKNNSWEDVINMLDSKYGIPAIQRSDGGLFVDGCHKIEAICKGNVRGWTLSINGKNHTCRPSTNAICKCIVNAINDDTVNEGSTSIKPIFNLIKQINGIKSPKIIFSDAKRAVVAFTHNYTKYELEFDVNGKCFTLFAGKSPDVLVSGILKEVENYLAKNS